MSSGGLRWGVEPICAVLEIAPSTYYDAKTRAPSARAERDAGLRPKLRALWERNYSVYGRRKLTKAAKKAGLEVGRDQVARLMRAEGIRGASRWKRRFTTHSDPAAVRAPDLLRRDFTATRSNHKWVADFTYCSTWSGVVYVAFVIDVFARPPHRRLEGIALDDRRAGRRRLEHGRLGPTRCQARRADLPLRR
jgi:putative transposase